MSKQSYIGIEPKRCNECGKDYTPVVCSDECPHSKIDVSEQDELLLTEIDRLLEDAYLNGKLHPMRREAFRDEILAKVKQHSKQQMKEVLEEIESRWGWSFDKNVWQAYKKEVLKGGK